MVDTKILSDNKKIGIKVLFKESKKNEITIENGNIVVSARKKDSLDAGALLFEFCKNYKINEIYIENFEFLNPEKFLLGFYLASYEFDKYKKKEEREIILHLINFDIETLEKINKIKNAIFLARDLGNEPANTLYPQAFVEKVNEIFKEYKEIIVESLDKRDLERENLNAILAIGNSSIHEPRLLIIKYLPTKETPIILIGKGVCFDAGGLNIKPSGFMENMKSDKSGAANVVAIIKLLADLKIKKNVIGIIPLVENILSDKSIRPSDIIKIGNKSVEIISTDAEGRLILADAIEYAKRFNPSLYIILATLTGAQIVALGYKIAALYSNDKELIKKLMKIGKEEKEYVWPLPLPSFYKELIKGEISDLKNIPEPISRDAGSIVGALFLKEFIGKNKFVYLDIAGPAIYPKNELWLKKGASGFGVRLIANFIANL